MHLLSHEDANVRYEALLCVQKLMVQNWEYLGRQLEKEGKKVQRKIENQFFLDQLFHELFRSFRTHHLDQLWH